MSVQISYKKQIAVVILFFCMILLSIEGIVRIFELFDPPNCSWINRDALSSVEFFKKRQLCSDVNQLIYNESPIRLMVPNQHYSTLNINSFGFRGAEITKEKQENTYRIFLVGGSTVFGAGATSDAATISGFLQKKFDNAKLPFNVEVINAGTPGSHSLWESYYVKTTIREFKPDLVIVYDGWNDAGGLALNAKINTDETVNDKFEFRFKNFPFYRTPFFINYNFLKKYTPASQSYDKTDFTNTNSIVNSWKERWDEVCILDNKDGIKTVVLVQASARSGTKTLTQDEKKWSESDPVIVQRLSSMANSLGELTQSCDKTMDMRGIMDNVPDPVFYDSVHTNDLGNEIISDKIFSVTLPIVLQH